MSDDPLTVKPLGSSDIPAALTLLKGLSQDVAEKFDTTEDSLVRALDDPKLNLRGIVAGISSGEIIGIALYFPYYSTSRAASGVFILDLAIAPGFRRKNIGATLLASVFKRANEEWQAQYIVLGLHSHNENAEKFYQRLGFVNTEQELLVLEAENASRLGAQYAF